MAFLVGLIFLTIIGFAVYYAFKTDELLEDLNKLKVKTDVSGVINKYKQKFPKKTPPEDYVDRSYTFNDSDNIVKITAYYYNTFECTVSLPDGSRSQDKQVSVKELIKMIADGSLIELSEDELIVMGL